MSGAHQPVFVLVAGPNGAGKTTLTGSLATDLPIVNADTIMLEEGLSPIESGRKALRQVSGYIHRRQSFLLETTISGKGLLRQVERAREAGFFIALHYVCVETPDISCARVDARFQSGQGHHVPLDDVKRRYWRSLDNLPHFLLAADHAVLYDNTGLAQAFRPLCRLGRGRLEVLAEERTWPRWAQEAVARWRALMAGEASRDAFRTGLTAPGWPRTAAMSSDGPAKEGAPASCTLHA